MRRTKLRTSLYQFMFAGCVSVSFATPAFAGFFPAPNGYSPYGYSKVQNTYAGYRFRPIEQKRAEIQRWQYNMPQQRFVTHYRPYYGQFVTSNSVERGWQARWRTQYNIPGAYANQNQTIPAFARQYAWEPAQPKGFRRGEAFNHYANQSNETMEQSSTPVYRSEPITTQGFRYRSMERNANFVSFADKVKSAMPVTVSMTQQQLVSPIAEPKTAVVPKPVHSVNTQVNNPINKPVQANHRYVAGQSFYKADNFSFRPDARFQPTPSRQTQTEIAKIETVPQKIVPVPVSFELANAELPKTGDNSLDQWSFRPVQPAF